MIQIKIKLGDIEIEYTEPSNGSFPRIVTPDKYSIGVTKSERIMQVIKEMVDQAIKMKDKEDQNESSNL